MVSNDDRGLVVAGMIVLAAVLVAGALAGQLVAGFLAGR